jgi:fructose-bisphosphate aldolase class 1
LVSVGPFSDEQKAKADAIYKEYKEARTVFLEKTLAPMRFNKSIWQRSNVNKAAFNKMMQQLNGKAQDFKNLIPQIEEAGIDTKKIAAQTRNLVGLLFPILDSERLVQNAHDITRSAEVIYQTFLIEFAKLPEEK